MWPDPTDISKKKPSSLGGTPANKFINIICISTIVGFLTVLHLSSYTPFVQNKIKEFEPKIQEAKKRKEIKAFISDPFVQRALDRKQREYEENPEARRI